MRHGCLLDSLIAAAIPERTPPPPQHTNTMSGLSTSSKISTPILNRFVDRDVEIKRYNYTRNTLQLQYPLVYPATPEICPVNSPIKFIYLYLIYNSNYMKYYPLYSQQGRIYNLLTTGAPTGGGGG